MRLFRAWFLFRCLYPEAIFRIRTDEKILFLTFDDGPDPVSTPYVLNTLGKHQVRAMFFCSGVLAEEFPDLIAEIINHGHIVGNHGYRHHDGWKIPAKEYYEDIEASSRFTSDKLFRPPYGHLNLNVYRELKKKYRIIFWDIMPYDFDPEVSAERSLKILSKKIRPGSIIVLHDSQDSSCREFLEDFLVSTLNKGFRFEVTI
jgi:peptidoglycan-N-acetylglucosamine deacetylase